MRFRLLLVLPLLFACAGAKGQPYVLKVNDFRPYIDELNSTDNDLYAQAISNAQAWNWIREDVPLFDCPDKEFTRTYYFRWWTYRKHIESTPDGYVITEFLPKVGWARKYNTISCAAGHHFYEGRWIRNQQYLDDYAIFWFRKGGEPRRYSFWAADAIWNRYLVTGNKKLTTELLPDLIANYKAWESDHLDANGLFWQIDDRDGMEMSIGGSGYRATINSYMFGDAQAIANIADLAGKPDIAADFRHKASAIKHLVETRLWDAKGEFFKVLPRETGAKLTAVGELHGYTPWYFDLPGPEFSVAWSQITDPKGFKAAFGPATAEQRDPGFKISYEGHECQWNGPSWPYATSVTLTAMANLLHNYQQTTVTKLDYFDLLRSYVMSQRIKLDDGKTIPWIDEDLNPYTGDWISRSRLKVWNKGSWDAGKGGVERGKDYNHSTFCDLVITGLVGLRPSPSGHVSVDPLLPDGKWDYFCLDNVPYHGHTLTILYDRTGKHYAKGPGLRIYVDGKESAHGPKLGSLSAELPSKSH